MDNLLPHEKKILEYVRSKREAAKTDAILAKYLATIHDFLRTIDELRQDNNVQRRAVEISNQLLEAKRTAYNVSVQERARILEDNRFLREQIEKLKR